MSVTCCIPSIPPRAKLLTRAVESVLAQTHAVDAISIAIDHKRQGAAMTRNHAMMAARTEWIALLDDDDEWKPEHLAQLVAYQRETGADVVVPWFDVAGGSDPFPDHFGLAIDSAYPHSFPITVLVRTEWARDVGWFPVVTPPPGEHAAGEDLAFWRALGAAGATFVHLPERTWIWHHSFGNTGGRPDRW